MIKFRILAIVFYIGYLIFFASTWLGAHDIQQKYAKDGRLLWEFDKRNAEVKFFDYKVSGGEWVLDKVRVFRDLNRDGRIDKENDIALRIMKYEGSGNFNRLLYIICNPMAVVVIREDELPDILSKGEAEKRELIAEHLTKDLVLFKKKSEENLDALFELQKSGKVNLSESEFQALRILLNTDISEVSKRIETVKEECRNIEFSIQLKGGFYLVGKKGKAGILKNSWAGLSQVSETRHNPFTQRQISIKTFENGISKTFYEFDEMGKKYAFASFKCNEIGKVVSVQVLDREGITVKEFFLNTLGIPYLLTIKVAPDKWFNWPNQLSWPIEDSKLNDLLSHEKFRIKTFR
jgi:hypothetical protein